MQLPGAVKQSGIGIAITIKVSPYKLFNARDASKGMHRQKGSIAVIAKHQRQSGCCTDNYVEVPIRLNIDAPGSGVTSLCDRARQLGLSSYVYEGLRIILPHKSQSTCARQYEICFEVIVEINSQHTFRAGLHFSLATGKRKCSPG